MISNLYSSNKWGIKIKICTECCVPRQHSNHRACAHVDEHSYVTCRQNTINISLTFKYLITNDIDILFLSKALIVLI